MPSHFTITKLDRETRSFMERGFSQDFRNVSLAIHDDAWPSVAPACTLGEHIVISRKWHQPETWFGRCILAHELAHVVQQRRGKSCRTAATLTPPAGSLVEAEAGAAAALVASGGRFRCELADYPDRPRCYGLAGHYYTIYFVLLCAGLENKKAAQLAFLAQMPDQVAELHGFQAAIRLANPPRSVPPRSEKVRMRDEDLKVLMGLHCLTGGESAPETERRTQVLMDADLNSLAFGLGLHPFGDSFAHRKLGEDTRLYGPRLGHVVEWFTSLGVRGPEEADHIDRRPSLYCDYCLSLYDVICKKTPDIKKRLLTLDDSSRIAKYGANISPEEAERSELRIALIDVYERKTDLEQIKTLRLLAENRKVKMHGYRPESENPSTAVPMPMPWKEFQAAHTHRIAPSDLDAALRLALAWAKG